MLLINASRPAVSSRQRTKRVVRLAIVLVSAILLAQLSLWTSRVLIGKNLHTVIPGSVYRSAQLSAESLQATVERYGIKSVINLRGPCPTFDWYHKECRVLEDMGVARVDTTFSSTFFPHVREFRKLVEALDTAEKPVLVHCRRGVDRTGLAAGVALLLSGQGGIHDARKQLTLYYGHVRWGPSQNMVKVFDLYEDWLRRTGVAHQPDRFREWVGKHYKPGPYWAHIEPLNAPPRLKADEHTLILIRVHNWSDFEWQFKKNPSAGVHLRVAVLAADGSIEAISEGGLYETTLGPGGTLEIPISIPPIGRLGSYTIIADMSEGRDAWFALHGSKSWMHEVDVVE